MLKQFDAVTETKQSWKALLEAVVPLVPQFKLLLDAGFFDKMVTEFAINMNETTNENDLSRYYSNQYWAGAILTLISSWIRNGMDADIDQLSDIGANLMINGIATAEQYGNKCK